MSLNTEGEIQFVRRSARHASGLAAERISKITESENLLESDFLAGKGQKILSDLNIKYKGSAVSLNKREVIKIQNPRTGRWVSLKGITGQNIIKNAQAQALQQALNLAKIHFPDLLGAGDAKQGLALLQQADLILPEMPDLSLMPTLPELMSESFDQIAQQSIQASSSVAQSIVTKSLVQAFERNPLSLRNVLPTQNQLAIMALQTAVSMTPQSVRPYLYSGMGAVICKVFLSLSNPIFGVLLVGFGITTWFLESENQVDRLLASQEQAHEAYFQLTGRTFEESTDTAYDIMLENLELSLEDELDEEELEVFDEDDLEARLHRLKLLFDIPSTESSEDKKKPPSGDPDPSDSPEGGGGGDIGDSDEKDKKREDRWKKYMDSAKLVMAKFWSFVKFAAKSLLLLAKVLLESGKIVWWIICVVAYILISLKEKNRA